MLFMCTAMWASPRKGPPPLWISHEKANKANKQIHVGRCVRCWSILGFGWKDLQLRLSHESSLRRKWQLFPTGRHPRLFTLSWGQRDDYCVFSGLKPTETRALNGGPSSLGFWCGWSTKLVARRVLWNSRLKNGNIFRVFTMESGLNRIISSHNEAVPPEATWFGELVGWAKHS